MEENAETREAAKAVGGTELLAMMNARAQQKARSLRCWLEKRLILKVMCMVFGT